MSRWEIAHWDRRADDLRLRLQRRREEFDQEEQISVLPPVVLGGVAAVPVGLLARMTGAHRVHYIRRPFQREPDFGVTSVMNYDLAELVERSERPS